MPPVTPSASPSARLAATSNTTLTDSAEPISCHASVRVTSSTSTPTIAASAIGMPPTPAASTTPARVSSATGDLRRRGSASRSSSISATPSRCSRRIASACPCSSSTSPGSTRTSARFSRGCRSALSRALRSPISVSWYFSCSRSPRTVRPTSGDCGVTTSCAATRSSVGAASPAGAAASKSCSGAPRRASASFRCSTVSHRTSLSPARSTSAGSGAASVPSARRIWRSGSLPPARRSTARTVAPTSGDPSTTRSSASNTGCACAGCAGATSRSSQGATSHR